jgi:hypothetical protein
LHICSGSEPRKAAESLAASGGLEKYDLKIFLLRLIFVAPILALRIFFYANGNFRRQRQ